VFLFGARAVLARWLVGHERVFAV
jgi:ER-derived vesicles protein